MDLNIYMNWVYHPFCSYDEIWIGLRCVLFYSTCTLDIDLLSKYVMSKCCNEQVMKLFTLGGHIFPNIQQQHPRCTLEQTSRYDILGEVHIDKWVLVQWERGNHNKQNMMSEWCNGLQNPTLQTLDSCPLAILLKRVVDILAVIIIIFLKPILPRIKMNYLAHFWGNLFQCWNWVLGWIWSTPVLGEGCASLGSS